MISLINNSQGKNHFDAIEFALNDCKSVNIAVAFFKYSGLRRFLPFFKKAVGQGISVNLIVGIDFALTEPSALKMVHNLFLKSKLTNLFLAKPQNTFHPKLYWIEKENTHTIICGSANCTEGGYYTNDECSILIKANEQDGIVHEVTSYFNNLLNSKYVSKATLLAINNYEQFFKNQKIARKSIQQKPIKKALDYKILREYLETWKKKNDVPKYNSERVEHYRLARKILDEFTDGSNNNEDTFRKSYDNLVGGKGIERLWHSGSLHRHKAKTIKDFKNFIDLVQLIKSNIDKTPDELWGIVKAKKVKGVGGNIKTEIMMTYAPSKFPNLNNNPIRSLQEGGCFLKTPTSFNKQDYQAYADLLQEMGAELGLKSMLEIDSFLNNIYWKVKHKPNESI